MHIPDSYLSPQTLAPTWGIMIPLWAWALARLRRTLRARQVPLLALGAAFTFLIMMFNVPIPGTSGHAAGGVLVAVLLGPWAAIVTVSLALIVQALIFGDGGVLAIAANCLNIAVIMPLAGWGIYRLIALRAGPDSPRQWIGAALGGYVGLNAAAFTTAVMFGIQPLIAHDAAGRALYQPLGLQIAIPAMMIGHLIFFGPVEAIVTGLAVRFFQRTSPDLLAPAATAARQILPDAPRPLLRWVLTALLVLALLSPLGIVLPTLFHAGGAWGEWSPDEVGKMVGYIPRGMQQFTHRGRAPLPDYALPGQESAPLGSLSLMYVLSGLLGIAVLGLVIFGLRALFARKDRHDHAA
ncbi:MAG: cobalt transporter CbiM [Armatimonadota bacterium]